MKKQIRQQVFETNSSSTHSICIAKDCELTIPESLHFSFGEFGWDYRTLKSVDEKASYLYTGLHEEKRIEDVEKIMDLLREKGIQITFDPYETDSPDNGYVDHSDELKEFLDAVCSDENKLMRFLFSPLSFILTGNDNDGDDDDALLNIDVSYPYDHYFKGN